MSEVKSNEIKTNLNKEILEDGKVAYRYRVPIKRFNKHGELKEYIVNKTMFYKIDIKKKRRRELLKLITTEIKKMDVEKLEDLALKCGLIKN